VFRKLWERTKLLWRLATTERATPREIFWSLFLGAFAGCTPAMGFHGIVAIALATLFRKNRLFAWLGARISNVIMLPFIVLAEVQIAHRIRAGEWLSLDIENVKEILRERPFELLIDWLIGMWPVGAALGVLCGALGYGLAWLRDRRKARVAVVASEDAPKEAA
jgi:uncharacterized protein (DUF2062 family)